MKTCETSIFFKHVFFFQKAPGAYKKLVGCHYLKNVNEITCIITGLSGSH